MSDSPDNPHPLDETLRRHLSSYGDTPSPRVWAGVRAQLPGPGPAATRWRRPHRRLSLLLLLLLSVGVGIGLMTNSENLLSGRPHPTAAAETAQPAGAQPSGQPVAAAGRPDRASGSAPGQLRSRQYNSLPPARPGTAPEATAGSLTPADKQPGPAAKAAATVATAETAEAPLRQAGPLARAGARSDATGSVIALPKALPQTASRTAPIALTNRSARRIGSSPTPPAAPEATKSGIAAAAGQPASRSGRTVVKVRTYRPVTSGTSGAGTVPLSLGSDNVPDVNQDEPLPLLSSTALATAQLPAERVAFRQVVMPPAAPLGTRPKALALSADSAGWGAAKSRRWAVQAGAGPALSYRILRQPWRAGPAELAQLERPSLGWGAQVQLRRVLSGRWALAAGLGFQQYATQWGHPESPASRNSLSYASWRAASAAAPRRDTYNLLVLPVQVSYALSEFDPRWQVAALAGIEPGRYLGGRSSVAASTSGLDYFPVPASPPNSNPTLADFSFSQRTYGSAAASPYRAWNLSLSLGLDLRYRLAPASRWQVLVQPTARGLVSPFARTSAADYSRRPFSLGGLAGLSWDVR